MPVFARFRRPVQTRRARFETLESRQLLAATVVQAPPNATGAAGTGTTIDLSRFIDDPSVNTQVRFATELGNIDLQLFDQQKPITVANFLKYVREGRYDGTFVHRSVRDFVIQGGGFAPPSFAHIPTDPPIQLEASTPPVLSNTRGTIAMARTSSPNSATSEWFINTDDNAATLDPGSPTASDPAGYAVFGEVINGTLTTVDAIAALPIFDVGGDGSPFGTVPLRNYTQQDFQNQVQPTANNLVTTTATTLPKLTYQVSSSDPAVATATVNGNRLALQYGAVGTTQITVTGTDTQGQSVSQTFNAEVTAAPNLSVTLGGTSGAQSVTFTDADGTVTTVSLKGPGTATATFGGTGLTQATARNKVTVSGAVTAVDSIAITGATAATAVTVTGRGGNGAVDVATITSDAALKSLSGKTVNLTGPLTAGGAIGKLDLGSATNAAITLGGGGASTVNIAGAATGTTLTSAAPLKSVTATSFATGTSAGSIAAPSIDKLTSKGDFAHDVNVSGAVKTVSVAGNLTGDVVAGSIGSVAVRGAMTGSTVSATGTGAALGRVTVNGAATGSSILSVGSIAGVTLGSASDAAIYAGLPSGVTRTALPTAADVTGTTGAINAVTIKGTTADTNIAAATLGRVNLGAVTLANAGTPFGIVADRVASITGSAGGPRLALKKLETQADVTAQTGGNSLQDLQIVLI
jgi:peptidyl-prolyl cis-trans isomerase A (cyclophilin A)